MSSIWPPTAVFYALQRNILKFALLISPEEHLFGHAHRGRPRAIERQHLRPRDHVSRNSPAEVQRFQPILLTTRNL